ncbi:FmdB family transcriptional regulator [Coriobacteriia bacterium Es71-Z0120]|uniref:FmdB family zinc ribbon protein n=1 Tax=Parvivirga hydrogeniphila TaxID=2939460 RepID=UPI002260A780|nr:FmdB family zinc ribbon protein [Parvivirga hydrogeniphila]MCL4079541.1 FmdB family transcriptional regulator [Parvivirga hydrogeniphila]
MPKYDYKCEACETVFEVTRPFGDTSPESCPQCGGATKRLFAPVGIVFKGSGFHNTDYKPRPKEGGSGDGSSSGASSCAGNGSAACSSCPAAEA